MLAFLEKESLRKAGLGDWPCWGSGGQKKGTSYVFNSRIEQHERRSTLLNIILTATLIVLSIFQQPAKQTRVILDREQAQAIARLILGGAISDENRVALRAALKTRRSPADTDKFLAAHCRDFGDGPSYECLQKLVVLELEERVAAGWLLTLRDADVVLGEEDARTIALAFCRAGVRLGEVCKRK